jgi:hypothetical protein
VWKGFLPVEERGRWGFLSSFMSIRMIIESQNILTYKITLYRITIAVVMKSPIFKGVRPCIPFKVTWRFGGTYRLYPQSVESQKKKLFIITIIC